MVRISESFVPPPRYGLWAPAIPPLTTETTWLPLETLGDVRKALFVDESGEDSEVRHEDGGCLHGWEVVTPVFLSNTPAEHRACVVPFQWCVLCGALRHDFAGEKHVRIAGEP